MNLPDELNFLKGLQIFQPWLWEDVVQVWCLQRTWHDTKLHFCGSIVCTAFYGDDLYIMHKSRHEIAHVLANKFVPLDELQRFVILSSTLEFFENNPNEWRKIQWEKQLNQS